MQQQQPHRRGIKLVLILLCLLVYALVYVCVWVSLFSHRFSSGRYSNVDREKEWKEFSFRKRGAGLCDDAPAQADFLFYLSHVRISWRITSGLIEIVRLGAGILKFSRITYSRGIWFNCERSECGFIFPLLQSDTLSADIMLDIYRGKKWMCIKSVYVARRCYLIDFFITLTRAFFARSMCVGSEISYVLI